VKWFCPIAAGGCGPLRSRNRDRRPVFAVAARSGPPGAKPPFIPEISRFDPFRCATAAQFKYQFCGNFSAGVVAIRESCRFERSYGRIPATKMY